MTKCVDCNNFIYIGQDALTLVNTSQIHVDCANDLPKHLKKLETIQLSSEQELKKLRVTLSKNSVTGAVLGSFVGALGGPIGIIVGATVGGFVGNAKENEKNIKHHEEIILKTQQEIKQHKNKMVLIYDYWPDYPPDWQERRKLIMSKSTGCEVCNYNGRGYENRISKNGKYYRKKVEPRPLQVHHLLTIRQGGSHRLENLKLLCRTCHEKEHGHNFSNEREQEDNFLKNNPFTKKIELLMNVISDDKVISIHYTDRNKQKTIRRIRPMAFIKIENTACLEAFCYLRNDKRTFTIRRMSKIKIE